MNQLAACCSSGKRGCARDLVAQRMLASVLVMLMLSLKKQTGSESFSFVWMLACCLYVLHIRFVDMVVCRFEVVCAAPVVRLNHCGCLNWGSCVV